MQQSNDQDKYKRPDLDPRDLIAPTALTTVEGLKMAGQGSAKQGLKTLAGAAGTAVKGTANVARVGGIGTAELAKQGISAIGKGVKAVGLRGLGTALATGLALNDVANTDTEDYYERFGLARNNPDRGMATHLGITGLGFASDIGNAITLGAMGKYLYKDKIRQANEAKAQQTRTPTANPANNASTTSNPSDNNKSPIVLDQNTYHFNYNQPTAKQPQMSNDTPATSQAIPAVNTASGIPNELLAKLQADLPQVQAKTVQTRLPTRTSDEVAQRNDLLQQALTVQKGARGLTANQMQLANNILNEDIKMAQERYLQQNNLNQQAINEAIQQNAQNARQQMAERGQMARGIMTEQGQNNRFAQNLGLDYQRMLSDNQNQQAQLGLHGLELADKLGEKDHQKQIQQEQLSLYRQYGQTQDPSERQDILKRMAVLAGKNPEASGQGVNGKDRYILVDTGQTIDQDGNVINSGQAVFDTQTQQYVGAGGQANLNSMAKTLDLNNLSDDDKAKMTKIMTNSSSAEQKIKELTAMGYPQDIIEAVFAQYQK